MRGATGLQNLGNTCFLNATIQCMANTPLLREYFLSSQYLRDIREQGTSRGLRPTAGSRETWGSPA